KAFAGAMLYLALSGKYLQYVVPRLRPYLYFTAAVMTLWALSGLRRLFEPQHRLRAAHCFALAAPLLLLLLPHTPLGTGDLSVSYVSAGSMTASSNESRALPAAEAAAAAMARALPGLDRANRTLAVADEDFAFWLTELYENMEQYEGYTVSMTGFVINDPEILAENEFVPARMMMSCCVGDLAPVGLLCTYDQARSLEPESWVTVEGTLVCAWQDYGGVSYNDPRIAVARITPAEEIPGYVYPY
ncbi:MAG TPA: TIGR03943 family protein, partial [Clostridia bacterium]|nr:TIGR03943 family protein [Clostridia bacterium]